MDEDILLQIHRYISGSMDEAECNQFETWRAEDVANEQLYQDTKLAWDHAGSYRGPRFSAQDRLAKMPFGTALDSVIDQPKKITIGYRVMRIAAVALIAVIAWYFFSDSFVSWETHLGSETEFLTLSDGSRVHLNDNAELAAPATFAANSEREVRLRKGEAFFEVQHNEASPFHVTTDQLDVRVLGTSFNVEISESGDQVSVCVLEGKVRVTPRGSEKFIELEAGECGILSNEQQQVVLQKKSSKNLNELAWHTGELTFKDAPVSEVLDAVEDAFDVEIDESSCKFLSCPLTIPFKEMPADKILETIASVFNAKVHKVNATTFTMSGGSTDCGG